MKNEIGVQALMSRAAKGLLNVALAVILMTPAIDLTWAGQTLTQAHRGTGVRVGADPNREPNFTHDLIIAINQLDPSLHLTVKDGYSSLRRVDNDLALGDVDVFFGIRKSEDRAKVLNFLTDVPLYCIDYRVAVRMDDHAEPRSLDDIRALGIDAVILAVQGRLYAQLLKQQPGLTVDDGSVSAEANVQKLLDHRGRFFYADSNLLKYVVKKLNLESSIRIQPTVFETDVLYAVTSKFLDPEIVSKLQAALQTLEKTGDLTKIRVKNNVNVTNWRRAQGNLCAR